MSITPIAGSIVAVTAISAMMAKGAVEIFTPRPLRAGSRPRFVHENENFALGKLLLMIVVTISAGISIACASEVEVVAAFPPGLYTLCVASFCTRKVG